MADPENFGGGGFEAQNLKNSDVFTKIESDFSAEIGNSNVLFAQIQVVSKKKKKKKKEGFTKIETDFWEIGKKKKVTFRSVGGDASRNGAELFEAEADFSAKIVTFSLVGGGCIPPILPPKSATGLLMYIKNNVGLEALPFGRPMLMSKSEDEKPSQQIISLRLVKSHLVNVLEHL